ncbi:hypothetical protein Scep_007528 [Stephania cephalantha]|uniref:La protein 1 n=1 Tax=Stephania cephalantha TaxID=152367 RepID=A0AAP0KA47_9MAGN
MASASLDEETAKKVLRQVEFYFSDSNLPRDKFLMKTIEESEDGLVSLALICSFARMKSHLGLEDKTKLEDVSEETLKAVAETLRSSFVVKVSEDGKRIGRSTELLKPEEVIEQVDVRTIAVSPLAHDVTLEELETFFAQYGKVNSIRLPRHVADKRFFCGTALVEFSSDEDTANVLKQSLNYSGADLQLIPKKIFDAEREKLIEEVERSHSSKTASNKDSSGGDTNYPKGVIISFQLKPISEESSVQNGINTVAEDSRLEDSVNIKDGAKTVDDGQNADEGNEKEKVGGEEEKNVEDKSQQKSSGNSNEESVENETVGEGSSSVAGKGEKDIVKREDLKELFQKYGTVKYVDFTMGAESGFIRFEEPEAAQKARAAAVILEGGLIVKNLCASLEAVTGEAEKDYWSKLRVAQHREGKGNWGRGGRNHRGGKHARSRDDSSGGRGNKAQKV